MKKRLIKIITLLLFIAVLIGLNKGIKFSQSTVRAVGDLSVDWGPGIAEGDPIFVVNNFAPGEVESRDVIITNNASTTRPVGIRGIKISELKNLSDKLLITIFSPSDTYYGGSGDEKTPTQFFNQSSGPDGISLFNLTSGNTKTITVQVTFDPQADNDYQEAEVVFDLRIGIAIAVPEDCQGISFPNDPVFGTEGNDEIAGTNKNDLIYTFEGNDKVQSGNGDDCVIGGPGNDNINNSNGNDILFGGEGNDLLKGSNGNDKIFGNAGNDQILASNGNDIAYGDDGDDYIHGSNGHDQLSGGQGNDNLIGSNGDDLINGNSGNDKLEGGNGKDRVFGMDGNDQLFGDNEDDYLDGGDGLDKATGNGGRDTCLAEAKITCEL